MIFSVAVADIFELKVAIKAHEPAGETEKQFCKRRVYIEVVFPQDVVRCKFTKVDLIEASESGLGLVV